MMKAIPQAKMAILRMPIHQFDVQMVPLAFLEGSTSSKVHKFASLKMWIGNEEVIGI